MKRIIMALVLICLLIPAVFAAEPAWEYDSQTKTLTIWDESAFADADLLKPYSQELRHLVFGEKVGDLEVYSLWDSSPETVTVHGAMTTWRRFSTFFGNRAVVYGQTGSFAEKWAKENSRTFLSLEDNTWTKGITNADQPKLNEATNTLTIRTARELAWVAWKTRSGSSLDAYTLELTNDIDLSGKVWLPINGFGGKLDGNGHTVYGLVSGQGGLIDNTSGGYWAQVSNVFLQDAQCALWGYNDGIFGTNLAENCGFTGRLWRNETTPLFYYNDYHNVWCAAQSGGSFYGVYCTLSGEVVSMTEAEMKDEAFLTTLNTLMVNAWDWVKGADGLPTLSPNSSRSWCNNTRPVTPKNNVYYIETPEELAYVAKLVNSGNDLQGCTVKVMADLDLSGKYWTPIGCSYSSELLGTFDGGGHTIRGLFSGNGEYVSVDGGLIGSGKEIHSVYLEDVQVSGWITGALASYAEKVYDCGMSGSVHALEVGGGLVGRLISYEGAGTCSIARCFAVCQVTADEHAACGGLVGSVTNGTVTNCYAIGSVSGIYGAGGLVSSINPAGSSVQYCYAACDVDGIVTPGGLFAGGCYTSNVKNAFWCSDNALYQDGLLKSDVGIGSYTLGTDPTKGKTLAQMKTKSTFSGWDFTSVWNISSDINGGLPHLRAFVPRTVAITKLTLSETTCAMKTGETYWLTANVMPLNATAEIQWSSSDAAVVKVSPNGKLTAMKAGTAVVTASSGKYSAKCTVTVEERKVNEYKITSLTARKDGESLTAIPVGGFYAAVQVEKLAEAGGAVVVLAAYSPGGQLQNLYFLEADVPTGDTYTLGVWIDNSWGSVGSLKAFLLPGLSVPDPLTAAAELKK